MIYVVGSGPSGVACAVALLRNGHEVTMLDAGIEPDSDVQSLVERMSGCEPEQWTGGDLAAIRGSQTVNLAKAPLKQAYGSDYPYRQADQFIDATGSEIGLKASFCKGGFSSVWGAAVMPYLAEDIKDWPITIEDLAPYYRSVFSFMNVSAGKDRLTERFPLYTDLPAPINRSRQAEQLLQDLERNADRLEMRGIHFGGSRVAVNSTVCKRCGLCLYGCPYGLIYNAAETVESLRQNPRFTYIKDVVVKRFVEGASEVEIFCSARTKGETFCYKASQLFFGGGVLSTTRVVLDSLKLYDQELCLKDSQYFLLPLLRRKSVAGVLDEDLHTLSQIFLEIFDQSLSANTIHLQVYSYNDYYKRAGEGILGRLTPMTRWPQRQMLERLFMMQGYLHSDLSGRIKVKLSAPQSNEGGKLSLQTELNAQTAATIKGLISKLYRCARLIDAVPLAPLLKLETPGRGFHSGGTLPMRAKPGPLETDYLGRPGGLKRVYLVDSSTFPSIPATTITLSCMANAMRIGDSLGAA